MKVIGITGNYGNAGADSRQAYLMADSSILYSPRPFFVPDFAPRFVAMPSIVVRTSRLGKCIAPRFAHRYWDAVTAAYNVRACGADGGATSAEEAALDRAFDGAAVVGEWVSVSTLDDVLHTPVQFAVNGTPVADCCLADLQTGVDDLLAQLSVRCSIKMGDLLLTGDCAAAGHDLTAGDRLTASVAGNPVLDVKVRL